MIRKEDMEEDGGYSFLSLLQFNSGMRVPRGDGTLTMITLVGHKIVPSSTSKKKADVVHDRGACNSKDLTSNLKKNSF